MNKKEFDAALMSALEDSGSFDDGVDFEKRLAQVGLRIVPSEPLAWQDKEVPGFICDYKFGDRDVTPLYADPTES
ncbi:hypothetical protein [Panacagrimonas sp.]|uniref:hypothetical protein n=1 Tax=Panacagrimonas sp. TaxID=2480088 RepID=UPI003B51BA85